MVLSKYNVTKWRRTWGHANYSNNEEVVLGSRLIEIVIFRVVIAREVQLSVLNSRWTA